MVSQWSLSWWDTPGKTVYLGMFRGTYFGNSSGIECVNLRYMAQWWSYLGTTDELCEIWFSRARMHSLVETVPGGSNQLHGIGRLLGCCWLIRVV